MCVRHAYLCVISCSNTYTSKSHATICRPYQLHACQRASGVSTNLLDKAIHLLTASVHEIRSIFQSPQCSWWYWSKRILRTVRSVWLCITTIVVMLVHWLFMNWNKQIRNITYIEQSNELLFELMDNFIWSFRFQYTGMLVWVIL